MDYHGNRQSSFLRSHSSIHNPPQPETTQSPLGSRTNDLSSLLKAGYNEEQESDEICTQFQDSQPKITIATTPQANVVTSSSSLNFTIEEKPNDPGDKSEWYQNI